MNRTLTWKFLLRDWRSGELSILVMALVLAVAVVVGISGFVSRLQAALLSESARFLAADAVVVSRSEPPASWLEMAELEGLQVAPSLGFPSMAVADIERMSLVSVKAVSAGYPLKGTLQWSVEAYGALQSDEAIPQPGEVWLAPRLFALLGVATGDAITVGEQQLTITGSVRGEPDATTAVVGVGPRLLLNVAGIPAPGVIQPGSRVEYRLLLGGNEERIEAFLEWLTPQLGQGQRVDAVATSQPRIGDTLERAQGFLLLAGSLAVVLATAAILLASRRFGERHTQYVAILKSLGAQSPEISRLYGDCLLVLGCLATFLGCAIGWLIQDGFIWALGSLLPVAPGSAGWEPLVMGAVTALVCLLFFAWPPLSRLAGASPLHVLRAEVDVAKMQKTRDLVLGGMAVFGLMWWYSGNVMVTVAVVAGLAVVTLLGVVIGRTLLAGGHSMGGFAGSIWRVALAGLQRRRHANALQMVIFAIAIMLMLMLTVVRSSLVTQWQAQLPPDVPNHFLLNLAPEERARLERFFLQRDVKSEQLYPMTRGRVMEVNSEALPRWEEAESETAPRQREANFTWSDAQPAGNQLTAGEWWPPESTEALVSVEEEFARDIGAALGDQLTLRIGADTFTVTVSSIRRVDWQSMRPNFFMVFPRSVLASYPGMYMTSFLLPPDRKNLLNELVRELPTVTVIELDIVITEMRAVVDQVARALELVLGVILLAGGLVLVAGIQSSLDGRLREAALLRALGAGKRLLLGTLWIEFMVLGGLAGGLAGIGAEAATYALQTQVFEMQWAPTPVMWWLGPIIGAVIVGCLGVWSCRHVVRTPPVVLLREI
ncbi:MAG: FtsX-like permease family protein [Halieaceae bacterium]